MSSCATSACVGRRCVGHRKQHAAGNVEGGDRRRLAMEPLPAGTDLCALPGHRRPASARARFRGCNSGRNSATCPIWKLSRTPRAGRWSFVPGAKPAATGWRLSCHRLVRRNCCYPPMSTRPSRPSGQAPCPACDVIACRPAAEFFRYRLPGRSTAVDAIPFGKSRLGSFNDEYPSPLSRF